MTIPDWVYQTGIILFMWMLCWGPERFQEGYYRDSFFLLIICICAYGWLWEHMQRRQDPDWKDRPPRPNEDRLWIHNTTDRLDEHPPPWTTDDEDTRREPEPLL